MWTKCRYRWLLLFVACLLAAGCENDVPLVDTAEADVYFSLYGYFLAGADTQYVRVVPFRGTLRRPEPGPIDAEVTSTDVSTGQTVTWQDSLVQNDDGSYSHVFYAPTDILADRTYLLEARRSDGNVTRAEAETPPWPVTSIGETYQHNGYKQDVAWEVADPAAFVADVTYMVSAAYPVTPIIYVTVPYAQAQRQTETGRFVTVALQDDYADVYEALLEQYTITPESEIFLYEIRMRLVIPHESWTPPGGWYDPYLLSNPGTFSNVEGGYGFIGGAVDTTLRWQLDPEVMENLNYKSPGGGSP